jgi:hypothetical protein
MYVKIFYGFVYILRGQFASLFSNEKQVSEVSIICCYRELNRSTALWTLLYCLPQQVQRLSFTSLCHTVQIDNVTFHFYI